MQNEYFTNQLINIPTLQILRGMNISSISLYNKALCSYMLVSYAGLMAGPNWPNFFYKSFFFCNSTSTLANKSFN